MEPGEVLKKLANSGLQSQALLTTRYSLVLPKSSADIISEPHMRGGVRLINMLYQILAIDVNATAGGHSSRLGIYLLAQPSHCFMYL